MFVEIYSTNTDFNDYETTEVFELSITLELDGFLGLEETKGELTMIEYPDYAVYKIKFPDEKFNLGGIFARLLGYDFRNNNFALFLIFPWTCVEVCTGHSIG